MIENVKAIVLASASGYRVHFVGFKLNPATGEVTSEATYKSLPENTDDSSVESLCRKATGAILDGTVYAPSGAKLSEKGLSVVGTFAAKQGTLPTKK